MPLSRSLVDWCLQKFSQEQDTCSEYGTGVQERRTVSGRFKVHDRTDGQTIRLHMMGSVRDVGERDVNTCDVR